MANDGYIISTGEYFQVYAPEDISKSDVVYRAMNKMFKDFKRLLKEWDNLCTVKKYFFVINNRNKGIDVNIEQAALKLMKEYEDKEIKVALFTTEDLQRVFRELSEEDQYLLFDYQPQRKPPSPEYSFEEIIQGFPVWTANDNRFHYSNTKISDIFGRDTEKLLLQEYINSICEDNKFSFWVVSGPAGVGKSKLLYSFIREHLEDEDWIMRFIPLGALNELTELHNYYCSKKVLLVLDYVEDCNEELRIWFQKMTNKPQLLSKNICVILLEREGMTGKEYPAWFSKSCLNRYPVFGQMYRQNFLELTGMTDIDQQNIMNQFIEYLKKQSDVTPNQKKAILDIVRTKFQDRNQRVRPLFILLVADVVLANPRNLNWTFESVLDEVYTRDITYWSKKLNKLSALDLLEPLCDSLMYATICGKWSLEDETPKILIKRKEELFKGHHKNNLSQFFQILTGYLEKKNSIVLNALEPDLIGEYFVLKQLFNLRAEESKYKEWVLFLTKRLDKSSQFLLRCIQDFSSSYNEDFGIRLQDLLTDILENADILSEKGHVRLSGLCHIWIGNSPNASHKIKDYLNRYKDVYQCWSELLALHPKDFELHYEDYFSLMEKWPKSTPIAIEFLKQSNKMLEKKLYSKKDKMYLWYINENNSNDIIQWHRFSMLYKILFTTLGLQLMKVFPEEDHFSAIEETLNCTMLLNNNNNPYPWKQSQLILARKAYIEFEKSKVFANSYFSLLTDLLDYNLGSYQKPDENLLNEFLSIADQLNQVKEKRSDILKAYMHLLILSYNAGNINWVTIFESKIPQYVCFEDIGSGSLAEKEEIFLDYVSSMDDIIQAKAKAEVSAEKIKKTWNPFEQYVKIKSKEKSSLYHNILYCGIQALIRGYMVLLQCNYEETAEDLLGILISNVDNHLLNLPENTGYQWLVNSAMRRLVLSPNSQKKQEWSELHEKLNHKCYAAELKS